MLSKRTPTIESFASEVLERAARYTQAIPFTSVGPDGKRALPKEFEILRAGTTETTKGPIRCSSAQCALMTATAAGAGRDKLPIDYDHNMVSWMGGDGRAAGWFSIEDRQGALWATDVEWTPRAAAMLADKEYRYFSPALYRDEDGFATELVNVALTNLPATLNQTPLVAASLAGETGRTSDAMTPEQLLAAHGCANLSQLSATILGHQTENARLKKSETDLLAASVKLQADLTAATAALTANAAAVEASERATLVATLLSEKKLSPALKGWADAQPLASLKQFAAAATPIVGGEVKPAAPAAASSVSELTPDELAVCAGMRIDPAAFAATKAIHAAQGHAHVTSVKGIEDSRAAPKGTK